MIAEDVFSDEKMTNKRPYVIISDTTPITGQYTALVISTNDYGGQAIALSDSDFRDGDGLKEQSYVCPWAKPPLQQREIDRRVGALKTPVVKELVLEARESIPLPEISAGDLHASDQSTANAEG